MTAPVPISGDQQPLLFTAAYQKKQFSTGDVFTPVVSDAIDCLATPPTTATAAEAWSLTFAQKTALGTWSYAATADEGVVTP